LLLEIFCRDDTMGPVAVMEEARLIPTIMGRKEAHGCWVNITKRIQPFHRE
jgi:hypothetical protein